MSSVGDTKSEENLDFNAMFLILKEQYAVKNQEDLAARLGIQPQAISNAKKAGRMPIKWIHRLAQKNLIPWERVSEIMQRGGSSKMEAETARSGVLPEIQTVQRGEEMTMAEIPIPYGLPTMKGIKRVRLLLDLLQRWVDEFFPERQRPTLIAWVVESDNMEPTLPIHSMVLVDTAQTSVSESGIFAFQTNGSLTFRRVLPRLDGNVDVVNDNRAYVSYNTPPASLTSGASRVVGRVIFKGSKI